MKDSDLCTYLWSELSLTEQNEEAKPGATERPSLLELCCFPLGIANSMNCCLKGAVFIHCPSEGISKGCSMLLSLLEISFVFLAELALT